MNDLGKVNSTRFLQMALIYKLSQLPVLHDYNICFLTALQQILDCRWRIAGGREFFSYQADSGRFFIKGGYGLNRCDETSYRKEGKRFGGSGILCLNAICK